ncbi:MAG: hypothetical protein P8H90_04620 [Tateyamaria sp.]|nr:hypothetical protein [Tateyamaria sp.]
MIDESLFDGQVNPIPHLRGDIIFDNVTVRTAENNILLEQIN